MINPTSYIWTFIGKVTPLAVQLITTFVLARYLTPEDFGQIGVLSVFIMVATILNDAGFGGSLIKEKNISLIDCSTVFVYNCSVSVLLYIILFACAGQIEQYFNSPGLCNVVRLVSLVFVINSFGTVSKALLLRHLRFKVQTTSTIVGVIVAAVVAICMSVTGYGVYSLIAYQIIQAIIITVWVIKVSEFKLDFHFSINSFKRLFSFGLYTTCSNVVDTIYENSLSFLFGRYLSITQAGYISQAKKIEEVSTTSIAMTINTASFPILSRIKAQQEFMAEAISLLRIISLFIFPLFLLISLYSDEIVYIVFGEKWEPVAPYLSVLMFAGIFIILETLTRNFIKSLGAVKELLYTTFIKRCIGICIILIAFFSIKEYILWGYVIGSFIGFFMNLRLFSKITYSSIVSLLRIIFISCVPAFILYVLHLTFFFMTDGIIFRLIFTALLLLVYYVFIMPLYGYDLRKILNLFKK